MKIIFEYDDFYIFIFALFILVMNIYLISIHMVNLFNKPLIPVVIIRGVAFAKMPFTRRKFFDNKNQVYNVRR